MMASMDPAEIHYITHIYVLDQDHKCVYLEALDPTNTEIARVEFDLPLQATKLTPYSYCNLHGLWYGVAVEVPANARPAQRHNPMEVAIPNGRPVCYDFTNPQRHNPMEVAIPNGRTVSPNRSYDFANPQRHKPMEVAIPNGRTVSPPQIFDFANPQRHNPMEVAIPNGRTV